MKGQHPWTIRPLAMDDRDSAVEVFYHGLYNEGETPPGREILDRPIMRPYLDGFPAADDIGFVCCGNLEQEIAGVIYCRFFRPDYCGVGFYRADVPELSIGVMPAYRNMGCGTVLMSALLEETDRRGLDVSLNCGLKNPARHLYERFGFSILASRPIGYLMLRKAKALQS